ncbi:hypothetical protein F4775DRAFT_552976 [Biscogniauxia sp. FL1348]|nr:hypothetical protein F4775DRAFT_552976 [Biscogniauxia sp. FL1348]
MDSSTPPQPQTPPRVSAPYGHACANCSKAKCKCITIRGSSSTCERCARLGRECRPSNGVRKQRLSSRRNYPALGLGPGAVSAGRAAQLEEKLDDLVSILRVQAAAAAAAATAGSGGGSGIGSEAAVVVRGLVEQIGSGGRGEEGLGSGPEKGRQEHVLTPADSHGYVTSTAGSTPAAVVAAVTRETPLSTAQAEETLDLFREYHLKTFPFVFIHPETTAAQLASERPYLWLNIRAICSKSPSQRAVLGLRCREMTAKKVLVDMERNVDLLIGVLAYLGWAMHQFRGKPQLVAMMNIAITLVTDLRLDRPTQDSPSKEENCFKSYVYPKVSVSVVRTNEERRATLACYAFCSNVSMFLKSQSMRWTPHMEDSLRKLATNPECPGDELLVTIVRAHRIIEDVAQVTWRSIDQDNLSSSLPPSSRPPPMMYVRALRHNVQVIKNELPESIAENRVALSYLYATEMIICDMPFWNNNPWVSSSAAAASSSTPRRSNPNPNPSTPHRTVNLSRLEAYHATLQASRACMDNFLSLEPATYVGFSFPLVTHFFRSTQVLYRLLLTEDPDWDRAAVAGSIDLMAAIERGAARFALVPGTYGFVSAGSDGVGTGVGSEAGGIDEDAEAEAEANDVSVVGYTHLDFYTKCARTLRSTIPVWDAALARIGLGRQSSSSTLHNNGDDGENGNRSNAPPPPPLHGGEMSVTGMGAGTGAVMEHHLVAAGSGVGFTEFMPTVMDFMDDSWWTDILGSWES